MRLTIFTPPRIMAGQQRTSSSIAILFVVMATAFITVHWSWRKEGGLGWRNVVRSDARGYYGYLTAIFIRNDLGNEPYVREFIHRTPTGTLNKYFCGSAIMMAPWFAIGHDRSLTDPKAPDDGHGRHEMMAISVGGWFYLLVGLLAMRAILHGLHIRDPVIAVLVVVIALGTTLLQFAAIQPAWSHIYSFCAVAVFMLLVQKLAHGASPWWCVAAAAVYGLVILIRPVNALVVLGVPVLLGERTLPILRQWVRRHWRILLVALAAGGLVLAIQPLLWYLQTGNWIEWSYRNEGFYWNDPKIFDVLFSFRRGTFIWTPVILFAAISGVWLWRWDPFRSLWTLIYWSANIYVISSWWIWYYGSGLGSRYLVEHYAVIMVPMALVLDRIGRGWAVAADLFLVLALMFHLLQFKQYQMEILSHEHMDLKKYSATFAVLDSSAIGTLGGRWDVRPYSPLGSEMVLETTADLEESHPYWRGGSIREHDHAWSCDNVNVIDHFTEYSTTFVAPAGHLPAGRELWLEVRMMRYEGIAGASLPALAVTSISRPDGSLAFYEAFPMNFQPGTRHGTWEQLCYRIALPAMTKEQELRFYIWNKGLRAKLLLDDLTMRIWAVRPYPGMVERHYRPPRKEEIAR